MTTTTTRPSTRARTATVTVTSVVLHWSPPDSDLVRLACGHNFLLEHDEANASLVGAETRCEGCS